VTDSPENESLVVKRPRVVGAEGRYQNPFNWASEPEPELEPDPQAAKKKIATPI
jgi:hypothetical protein